MDPLETWLRIVLRACVFGLGLGSFGIGVGIASDIPIAIATFAIPGAAMMAAALFVRGPVAARQKVVVGLIGLLLSLPLVLLVIVFLLAIDELLG